jgi:hypothetical protein
MDDATPTLGVHGSIRGRLHSMAAGRVLEIGFFRSSRCGSVVGDFTLSWRRVPPGSSHVALILVEGVSVFADRRLLDVLRRAGPELRLGAWLSRGTPTIRLAVPEYWIDFLDRPLPPGPRAGTTDARPIAGRYAPGEPRKSAP